MVKCPNCGKENIDGLEVCLNCGNKLIEPSEPDEPPRPPKSPRSPKKDKKLNKTLILFFIFIILAMLVGGFAYNSYLNTHNTLQYDDSQRTSDLIDHVVEDKSINESSTENKSSNKVENSSDNAGNSINFLKNPLDSYKTVDFDSRFSMDVDEKVEFKKYTRDQERYCEEHWISLERNSSKIDVYYWLANETYDFYSLDCYDCLQDEGDILIFKYKYIVENKPTRFDYMIFVSDDEDEIVALRGADLNILKTYASSISFH